MFEILTTRIRLHYLEAQNYYFGLRGNIVPFYCLSNLVEKTEPSVQYAVVIALEFNEIINTFPQQEIAGLNVRFYLA